MKSNLKRFTVSIPPEMEADLDSVKQRLYYRNTQNDMLKGLIIRGLETLKEEKESAGVG